MSETVAQEQTTVPSIHSPSIKLTNVPEGAQIHYEVGFTLTGVKASVANALRRTMISDIPNVGFDTTPYEHLEENSIRILTNTSAIHNEFMANRFGLVPICTYRSGKMNIRSFWDHASCERHCRFINGDAHLPDEDETSESPSGVPVFFLNVVNDLETRNKFTAHRPRDLSDNMVCVTTQDFHFHPRETENIKNFIIPDPQSQDYIILNKLKLLSSGKGEELDVQCVPRIGDGNKHSLYSPVGTVSYSFIQDQERIQEVYELYLEKISQERKDKGLKPYNDDEIREVKQNFDSLDAKRVVVRDQYGEPNGFRFNVESIGGMFPMQIVSFSLECLKHKCQDVLRCCQATMTDKGPVYELSRAKLELHPCVSRMDGYDLTIKGEDHTLGNLITKELQSLYQGPQSVVKNLLGFVSYKKPHPLKDEILFRLKVREGIDWNKGLVFLHQNRDIVDPRLRGVLDTLDVNQSYDPEVCQSFFTMFLFVQGINSVLHLIIRLQNLWKDAAGKWLSNTDLVPNPNFLSFSEEKMDGETWYPLTDTETQPMYQKISSFDI